MGSLFYSIFLGIFFYEGLNFESLKKREKCLKVYKMCSEGCKALKHLYFDLTPGEILSQGYLWNVSPTINEGTLSAKYPDATIDCIENWTERV